MSQYDYYKFYKSWKETVRVLEKFGINYETNKRSISVSLAVENDLFVFPREKDVIRVEMKPYLESVYKMISDDLYYIKNTKSIANRINPTPFVKLENIEAFFLELKESFDKQSALSNGDSFIKSLVLPKGFEAKQYNGMNRVHLKYKSVGFAVFNMNKNTYNLATRKEVFRAINVNDYSSEKNLGPNDAIIKGIPYSDTTILYRLIDYISSFEDARDAFDKHYLISLKEVEASEEEESHIQKELDELISLEKDSGEGYEYKAQPEQRKTIDDIGKRAGVSAYPRDPQKRINALKRAKYTCEFNPDHKSFISKKTDMRYMETHHLIPLEYWKDFNNSLDVEANIVCLCSNCHNEIHYGKYADKLIEPLYEKRKQELEAAGIAIDLDDLLDMYNGARIDK